MRVCARKDRLMWHSRGGVRYTDPMNSVYSEVWAALDLGGALGSRTGPARKRGGTCSRQG